LKPPRKPVRTVVFPAHVREPFDSPPEQRRLYLDHGATLLAADPPRRTARAMTAGNQRLRQYQDFVTRTAQQFDLGENLENIPSPARQIFVASESRR